MKQKIYLDYNATTPVLDDVVKAMTPFFINKFGNAASRSHSFGQEANAHLEVARETLLKSLKASEASQLIFTSGATESNNLAIKGFVLKNPQKKIHVVTQETEHACILKSCDWLKRLGHEVTVLKVDSQGFVNPDDLKQALKAETTLVSIMWANNEIGTIQNIKELLQVTKSHSNAYFHTDAAQVCGKIAIDLQECPVDFLSFSAHKLYGPKGIGALYINQDWQKLAWEPLLHGGDHEFGLRSGTVNVPLAVGFAKAFEMVSQDLSQGVERLTKLRDFFIDELLDIEGVMLNGSRSQRLCQNINVTIDGVLAENLIMQLPHLAFSTGSACASGSVKPSYVIQALGRSKVQAQSTVRFGLGRLTTHDEIVQTLKDLKTKTTEIRTQFS